MNALHKNLSGLCLMSLFMCSPALATQKSICANFIKADKICTNDLIVKNNCNVHTITAEDFTLNGVQSKPVVITESGYYKLCSNIDFAPTTKVASAIIIYADDVVLDLNGHTLNHNNTQSQVTGIEVVTGHNNVTILGNYGSITNFTQRGIYIQGGNKNVTIGNDTQLLISGCGFGTPITLIDGNQPIIQNGIQFGDMEFLTEFGFGPSNGLLDGLVVRNLTSSGNNTGGSLGDGRDFFFTNCSFSNNRDTRPVWDQIGFQYFGTTQDAVVVYGLAYFSNPDSHGIDNLQFENCSFDGNVADASVQATTYAAYCDSFNMSVKFSNLKIINCSFCNNEAKLAPRPDILQFNQTRGCVISGGENIILQDSEFSANEGGGLVDGLNISGLIPISPDQQNILQPKSFTIRNCVASNNRARTKGAIISNPETNASGSSGKAGEMSLDVVGFVIRYPHGLTMIDCVAEDNTGEITATETGYNVFTDGVLLFANTDFPDNPTNNVEIRGAKVSRNRNNAITGTCSGIRVLDGLCENVSIIDCVITENSFPDFQEGFFAAGVDITGASRIRPSLISVINCVINNHANAGVFTSLERSNIQNNIISFNTWGVILGEYQESPDAPISYPNASSVLDNTLLGNGVGVEDQPSQQVTPVYSTSLVSNNRAFNSGTGYRVTYEGDVAVPVESGTLPAFPAYPPAVLGYNLNFTITDTLAKARESKLNTTKVCKLKNDIQNKRWKR